MPGRAARSLIPQSRRSRDPDPLPGVSPELTNVPPNGSGRPSRMDHWPVQP
jgi:hypothetical protein